MSQNIRKVLWSPSAETIRLATIEQIIERWSLDIAIQFDDEVEALIERIKDNNHICPESKFQGVRKCRISDQTSLVYQIYDNHIEVIALIDNRSEHNF